jgi:hypothetical protein
LNTLLFASLSHPGLHQASHRLKLGSEFSASYGGLSIPTDVSDVAAPPPPCSDAQESPDVASKQGSHPDRWGPLAGFEGRGRTHEHNRLYLHLILMRCETPVR